MKYDFRELLSGRLARRLIVAIVLFSSAITVLTTAIQLSFDYRHDRNAIENSIDSVRLSQVDTLANSLWVEDWQQIQIQLDGMLRLPDMEWMALNVDGKPVRSAGTQRSVFKVTRQLPLTYQYNGRTLQIGELVVVASIDQVFWRLGEKAILILLTNAFKTFLVALFVFFIVYRWVTRHLERLAHHTRSLKIGAAAEPLALAEPYQAADARNEVDEVIVAINRMQESLTQTFEALRAEKEMAQVTLSSIGDAVVTTDAVGRVTFMNAMAEKLTGWSNSEAARHPLNEVYRIINFKTRLTVDDPVKKVLANGGTVVQMANDTTLISRYGREYQIANSGAPIFTATGELRGVVMVFRDVSEEYALHASLADRERNLRAVTDAVQDAIVRVDPHGSVVFINRAAEVMFATSPEDAVGRDFVEWIIPAHCAADADRCFADFANAGDGCVVGLTRELSGRRADGTEFPIELTVSPLQVTMGWHSVAVVRDISERKRAEAEIAHHAYYDALTDLPNRRLMLERLRQEIAISERLGLTGALIFIDLDHFKSVNDVLGHVLGDSLLRQTTGRLRKLLRNSDMVARLGGDEFVVLLPALGNDSEVAARQAQLVADKLRNELAVPFDLEGHEYHCSASMGVVLFPRNGDTADDMLRHADTAMYSAKDAGRNTVQFYLPEMQEAVEKRLLIESDMRHALNEDQFVVYYQPQVAVGAGHIIGAEALIRWQHPKRGLVSPLEFIPIAEETGLILALGDWILRTVVTQAATWLQQGVLAPGQTLSVNVSPRQFHQTGFVDKVAAIIGEAGIPPSCIKLEITESMVIGDVEDTIRKMEAIKAIGVKFSMDDFGTGYSSLSYLKRLPLDQLKIDRAFIKNLPHDTDDAAIVMSIISMARNLRLEVIAEGVENACELDFLHGQECFAYQGYYFSRPVPAEEFGALLLRPVGTEQTA